MRARTGHEIALGIHGEDSCLDGMSARMNPVLRRQLRAAGCQEQLEAHEIDAGPQKAVLPDSCAPADHR
jgi:hypothetical protein